MEHYNIEIGKKLKLESLIYRVSAKNKKEALKKVRELGFNCGIRLSDTFSGDFKPVIFDTISEEIHQDFLNKVKKWAYNKYKKKNNS